jgi:serine/threonine protein kinase
VLDDAEFTDFVQLGGTIGRGSSGTVVKAVSLTDFKIYALKTVSLHKEGFRSQIRKEIKSLTAMPLSPNIVKFSGAYFDHGSCTFVLEYMNRGSLAAMLETYGVIRDEALLRRVAHQVLRALFHLHSNSHLHRDIKPANILVNSNGEVKLSDFGIVREFTLSHSAETFIGTQVYMAPERIRGDSYTYPSDIWSFGLTLYAMIMGHVPYSVSSGFVDLYQAITGDELPPLPRGRFSAECRHFIEVCCLAKSVNDRWTAEELMEHPFILADDMTIPVEWPFETDHEYVESDTQDLCAIGDIVAFHFKELGEDFDLSRRMSMNVVRGIATSMNLTEDEVIQALITSMPSVTTPTFV